MLTTKFQSICIRIGTGGNEKIKFKPASLAVVNKVDCGTNLFHGNFLEVANLSVQLGKIKADEVIAFASQFIHAGQLALLEAPSNIIFRLVEIDCSCALRHLRCGPV